jgi:hypothetical protein
MIAITLVHAFYWSNIRMRSPVEPLLAILAAAAFMEFKRREPPNG